MTTPRPPIGDNARARLEATWLQRDGGLEVPHSKQPDAVCIPEDDIWTRLSDTAARAGDTQPTVMARCEPHATTADLGIVGKPFDRLPLCCLLTASEHTEYTKVPFFKCMSNSEGVESNITKPTRHCLPQVTKG